MATANAGSQKYKENEILQCVSDPSYFIKKYLYVQHPVKGRIPFALFDFQEECLQSFLEYKHNIIVKSRQLGLSETVSGYCLWLALFHRDKNIVIMATTLKTAGLLVRKIREKFKMLPSWMTKILNVTEPEANSKFQLILTNGSTIKGVAATDGAVRGEAGSIVVVDEAAHIDNLEEMWKAIWPALSTGGSSIIFSSPNGKNYFHEIFSHAEKTKTGVPLEYKEGLKGIHCDGVGANGFHAIKLPWTVHPERDQNWFDEQSAGMDIRGIAQEFLCAFDNSGTTFFGANEMDWIKSNIVTPVFMSGPKGKGNDLWVWKTPEDNHSYILSADIARGDAEDFSAFHITDTVTSEIVVEFMSKIPPDRFAEFAVECANKYNKAFIIFEKNTFGHSFGIKLRDLKYENIYYEEKIKEELIYCDEDKKQDLLAHSGFTIKPNNREQLINKLEECLRNRKIKICSSRFLQQMEHFIWTGKKAQSLKRKNDDLIMALVLLLVVFQPKNDEEETATGSMPFHMAFLASLKSTGVSKNSMQTGIDNFGAKQNQDQYGHVFKNTSNPASPIQSFNNRNENKFLGKKLAPGVSKEKVMQDYIIRKMFDWV